MGARSCFLLLVIVTTLPACLANHRRHRGPSPGQKEKLLRGRTLTLPDALIPHSSRHPAHTSIATARQLNSQSRRVVDFALHLRRDVVLWDEVSKDGVTLSKCHVIRSGRATFSLSGSDLEPSDYTPGTVFIIDETDFEKCSNSPTPFMSHIDPDDTQLFLSIKNTVRKPNGKLQITSMATSGRNVVPTIEIDVHDTPEPRATAAMASDVEYEDEPHSDWSASNENILTGDRALVNGSSLTLPEMSRITLQNKVIPLGEDSELELTAEAHVRITRFRLRRLRTMEFQWHQELSTSVSAKIEIGASLLNNEDTGPILKVFVPSLSFSVRVPVLGLVQTGGFVGLNWVSQLSVKRTASVSMEATFTKRQFVTARLSKLEIDARDDGSSAKGSGQIDVSPGYVYRAYIYGFYGIRPVVGMGVTVARRRLRRRGWRLYWHKERKSVSGNIGADFGAELAVGFKDPPFAAFTGSGLKLGNCEKCHSLQGRISLRGKNLSMQAVRDGEVEDSVVLVRRLFQIPVGTVCAVAQTCPRTG